MLFIAATIRAQSANSVTFLTLSEFQSAPSRGGTAGEWVEVKNVSGGALDFDSYEFSLCDGSACEQFPSAPQTFAVCNSGSCADNQANTLKANGVLLLVADKAIFLSEFPDFSGTLHDVGGPNDAAIGDNGLDDAGDAIRVAKIAPGAFEESNGSYGNNTQYATLCVSAPPAGQSCFFAGGWVLNDTFQPPFPPNPGISFVPDVALTSSPEPITSTPLVTIWPPVESGGAPIIWPPMEQGGTSATVWPPMEQGGTPTIWPPVIPTSIPAASATPTLAQPSSISTATDTLGTTVVTTTSTPTDTLGPTVITATTAVRPGITPSPPASTEARPIPTIPTLLSTVELSPRPSLTETSNRQGTPLATPSPGPKSTAYPEALGTPSATGARDRPTGVSEATIRTFAWAGVMLVLAGLFLWVLLRKVK